MTAIVNVDEFGRLVIPKAMRSKLKVGNGGPVRLELVDDHLEIKPAQADEPRIRNVGGFLVVDDGEPFDARAAVRKARERTRPINLNSRRILFRRPKS